MRKKIEHKMKESEMQLQGGERPVRLAKGNWREGEIQLPSSSRWGRVLWGGGRVLWGRGGGLLSTSLLVIVFPLLLHGDPRI